VADDARENAAPDRHRGPELLGDDMLGYDRRSGHEMSAV
jgi:hypothetical protein